MKKNVGRIDSIIRIILAICIFVAGFYFKSWWGLIGIIPFITGIIGNCPLYNVFGINTTCKNK